MSGKLNLNVQSDLAGHFRPFDARLLHVNNVIDKAALAATTVLSAISLIPATRVVGSLLLRGVALGTSTKACAHQWTKKGVDEKAIDLGRIALVALGIVGLVKGAPMLIVLSLVGDIALELLNQARAYSKSGKLDMFSLGALPISALAATAIALGSWQFMVAASAVQALFMFSLAYHSGVNEGKTFEAICYTALGAVGVAAAFSVAKFTKTKYRDQWHEVKNDTKHPLKVVDGKGNELKVIQPGESYRIPKSAKWCKQEYSYVDYEPLFLYYDENGFPVTTYIPVTKYDYYVYLKGYNEKNGSTVELRPYSKCIKETIVTKKPLDPSLLPTVPVAVPLSCRV